MVSGIYPYGLLYCSSPDVLLLDSGPDDPIAQPTNRGNKMKANAKRVREGAMGYINSEDFYRQVRGLGLEPRGVFRRGPVEGDETNAVFFVCE